MTTQTLPGAELIWDSSQNAQLRLGDDADGAALGFYMMRVLASAAERAASSPVSPVSQTLDATAPVQPGAQVTFSTDVDRLTRTMVFLNAVARVGETTVMTGTAVYRIG